MVHDALQTGTEDTGSKFKATMKGFCQLKAFVKAFLVSVVVFALVTHSEIQCVKINYSLIIIMTEVRTLSPAFVSLV